MTTTAADDSISEIDPSPTAVAESTASSDPSKELVASTPIRAAHGYSSRVAMIWFCSAAICLSLAASLQIGENRRVYLPFVGVPVPESCSFYRMFRVDCPGCGLTRTFIHMMHGRISDAWNLNPTGVFVFLFFASQIVLGACRFTFGERMAVVRNWSRWNNICLATLASALLVQWTIRLGAAWL